MQESAGTPTLNVMRERLQHLAAVEEIESSTAPEFTRWADVRLDRWLVDWCLRNGKEKTARMITAQKGIEVRPHLSYSRLTDNTFHPRVWGADSTSSRNSSMSTSSPTSGG